MPRSISNRHPRTGPPDLPHRRNPSASDDLPYVKEAPSRPMGRSIAGPRQGALHAVLADEGAFRAWYDRSMPRVYTYLFHRCGRDRQLAEELTQQTFTDALRTHD